MIEQVGKVFISLPLAYIGSQRGMAYGAAGALLGITVVEALALLYMIILYLRRRNNFEQIPQDDAAEIYQWEDPRKPLDSYCHPDYDQRVHRPAGAVCGLHHAT